MGYWGNRKPPFGTRINPDHPNSQGLVAFWPFNERMGATAYDVVNGDAGLTLLVTAGNPWLGDYFVLPATANQALSGPVPAYMKLQSPLTLLWQGIFPSAFTAGSQVFGMFYNNPVTSPFTPWMLQTDGGNGVEFSRIDVATQRNLLAGQAPGAQHGFGRKEQWACTLTTGAAAIYVDSNSRNAGGSTAGSASIAYTATSCMFMQGPAWTELASVYSRVIPTEQMDWLRVEPFDHFEAPGTNPVVFLLSPPVGGPRRIAGIGGGSAGPYAHLAGNK